MGHHLKGHHGKKTNANGGFLTKLLAGKRCSVYY